jgi:hypothetical protein
MAKQLHYPERLQVKLRKGVLSDMESHRLPNEDFADLARRALDEWLHAQEAEIVLGAIKTGRAERPKRAGEGR